MIFYDWLILCTFVSEIGMSFDTQVIKKHEFDIAYLFISLFSYFIICIYIYAYIEEFYVELLR